MPMSTHECAVRARRAQLASQSPEKRREISRQGALASAVTRVVENAPKLTDDQLSRLRSIFAPVAGAR